MSDLTINEIKKQLRVLYPELFDDDDAKNKVDSLITQADMNLHPYRGNVSGRQYQQLVQLMTAHLLYQSEDDSTSSVSIADVHFQFNNSQSKSSSNSGNGSGDKYLNQLVTLLHSLLGDQDWGVQFG